MTTCLDESITIEIHARYEDTFDRETGTTHYADNPIVVRHVHICKEATAGDIALALAELESVKRELVEAYERTENLYRRDEK